MLNFDLQFLFHLRQKLIHYSFLKLQSMLNTLDTGRSKILFQFPCLSLRPSVLYRNSAQKVLTSLVSKEKHRCKFSLHKFIFYRRPEGQTVPAQCSGYFLVFHLNLSLLQPKLQTLCTNITVQKQRQLNPNLPFSLRSNEYSNIHLKYYTVR